MLFRCDRVEQTLGQNAGVSGPVEVDAVHGQRSVVDNVGDYTDVTGKSGDVIGSSSDPVSVGVRSHD